MTWPFALPFAGLLLSIALGPLLFAKLWARPLRQDRRGLVCGDAGIDRVARGRPCDVRELRACAIIGCILVSASSRPGLAAEVFGTRLELQNAVRDGLLVVIVLLLVWWTRDEHREANGFSWEPIKEVAKLFAGIFIVIIPVLAALDAGPKGFFAWLLSAVTEPDGTPHEVAYFWYTGLMSAFLDNAPAYLLFFKLAGGDAGELMGALSGTLAAISMGAVYMGVLTYIGNAPNFMVAAIAAQSGIRMPSFFGYMLRAAAVLVPLFLLLTFLPVAPVLRLQ